jgi:hypothetical protein
LSLNKKLFPWRHLNRSEQWSLMYGVAHNFLNL